MHSIPHTKSNNLRCMMMNGQNKGPKSSDNVNQEINYMSKTSHGMNQAERDK